MVAICSSFNLVNDKQISLGNKTFAKENLNSQESTRNWLSCRLSFIL